jgi:hypothetical protein
MTLAQDPCPYPGFGMKDVHIKTEHIFRFCDHSINMYSSHRGKFYLYVGIISCLRYVVYSAFDQLCWQDGLFERY